MRYALVIDMKKCMGCHACSVACKAERGTPAGLSYNKVKMIELGQYPNSVLRVLPVSCMHCNEPKCVKVCPVEATYKEQNGIVLIDQKKCIGCGACVLACPYGSRTLLEQLDNYYENYTSTPYEEIKYRDFEIGTVVKCDFCEHRLKDDRLPACVETCPALARTFGDLDDPETDISKILENHKYLIIKEGEKTEPSVFYIRVEED